MSRSVTRGPHIISQSHRKSKRKPTEKRERERERENMNDIKIKHPFESLVVVKIFKLEFVDILKTSYNFC